ncbi:MAG: hypothetical protein FWG02_01675 [Holophagaceae bacterium]|nr:hypothetical protein [Holophagaceae bacterium]
MKTIIALALAITPVTLFSQTKIELVRYIEYKNRNSKSPVPDFRLVSDKFYTGGKDTGGEGTVRVESYSGKIVDGNYVITFRVAGDATSSPPGLLARFPALRSIKKIEFFDNDGNKFFEDTFEYVPMYTPTIVRAAENTFTLSNPASRFFSIDRAKTWQLVKNFDYQTNSFIISDDIANNPSLVIVVCSKDPTPPHAPGVALWAPNPSDYVLEFADDEEPEPQATTPAPSTTNSSLVKSSKKPEPKKSLLSRIFGK